MRALVLALFFLLAPALVDASDHPARLMFLMKLIDQVPTKAQLIEAGAGDHGEQLISIAFDRTQQRYPRMRAAGSLALFDGEASRAALTLLVEDDDVEVSIQALVALVHLEGRAARPRLEALLKHPKAELRASASRQLARLDRAGAP